MKPGIDEYAESKCEPTSALLNNIVKETYEKMEWPQMLTGRIEGRFLKMMVQISGAKNILEIGMFTGYSALSMAEGLPAGGKLTTCDIDDKCIKIAKGFFERSEHGKKIQVMQGPALDSLKKLEGPFDLVFIDADKPNYLNYYQAVLPKVKSGGVILVDNVLWSGHVINEESVKNDANTKAIVEFNDFVARDERVDRVMLTVRDGLFMIRKR
jgi:caffeoyl-CoA O-methyltransferase